MLRNILKEIEKFSIEYQLFISSLSGLSGQNLILGGTYVFFAMTTQGHVS